MRPYNEAEAAALVEAEQAVVREVNRSPPRPTARVALAANDNDVAEDELVLNRPASVADSRAIDLTTAQIVGVLKDLPRGLMTLAGNDMNTKKLKRLIRLAVGENGSTEGV